MLHGSKKKSHAENNKYFKVYNNEIQHIKNLWHAAKAVYKEKLIVFMKISMVWTQ